MNCLRIKPEAGMLKVSGFSRTSFQQNLAKAGSIPPMLVKPFELRLSAAEKFIQLVEARAPTVDDAHRLMLLPLLN